MRPAPPVRHQERVKSRQQPVRGDTDRRARWLRDGMIENVVAGLIGLFLIGYLLYALVRPDRF